MTKKLVAMGGGENGRVLENGTKTKYETELIDKEIVKLTEKENPNFLFICHAMSFSVDIEVSYYEVMKKIYEKLGCNCKILKSTDLYNNELVKELVNWADIIYEGGGDTKIMIDLWKRNGFDKILKDAWENGKVICGISAGAVCWFNSCNSDLEEGFEIVDCLDWYDLFITPHAEEEGRYESSKEELSKLNKVGLLLSNKSAIVIVDDKYKVLKSDNAYVLKTYWKNNTFYEETIDNNEYEVLDKLFK